MIDKKDKKVNKEKEFQEERMYPVVKHNDLIQNSRYALSIQEQKIIFYLITKIKPEDKEFHEYEFKIKNFCEVCGIDDRSGKNYELLKKTVIDLSNKSNWVTIIKYGEEVQTTLRWIEKAYLNTKKGTIRIRLDNDMKPYLLEIKNHFTSYDLYYILAMQSKYSIRLYELLKSYQYLAKRTFKLEELKNILDAEKYTTYADFRVRVLDVAVREINDFGDIFVEYTAEKIGKKYEIIDFTIRLKADALERTQTYKNIDKKLNPVK